MEFLKKDFENLHMSKIKDSLTIDNPINSYFFCYGNKLIMINRSKGLYKILASSQCNLKKMYSESIFDVIHVSKNLDESIQFFEFLVGIVCRR